MTEGTTIMPQEFLTTEELCAWLKVKKSWVWDAVAQQGLPVYRFGRQLRFDKAEVLDWVRARREVSVSG